MLYCLQVDVLFLGFCVELVTIDPLHHSSCIQSGFVLAGMVNIVSQGNKMVEVQQYSIRTHYSQAHRKRITSSTLQEHRKSIATALQAHCKRLTSKRISSDKSQQIEAPKNWHHATTFRPILSICTTC
jgi:hypothetical protein